MKATCAILSRNTAVVATLMSLVGQPLFAQDSTDSLAREPAEYRIEGNRTTVPLHLAAHEAVFVVFRRPAASPSRTLTHDVESMFTTVAGPWDVTFPPGFGAPVREVHDVDVMDRER